MYKKQVNGCIYKTNRLYGMDVWIYFLYVVNMIARFYNELHKNIHSNIAQ